MPLSKTNQKWWPWLLTAILVGGVSLLLLHRPSKPAIPPTATAKTSLPGQVVTHAAQQADSSAVKQADSPLNSTRDALRGGTNAGLNRQALAQLRQVLAAMTKEKAVADIRHFLDSKSDASTHLGFKVGTHGFLDDAPTLRTFLLDELARLDPAAAADYSKTILASMDSPDEWAVALRNLAAGDSSPEARAILAQKSAQMLQYSPWLQNPSSGFLEAFDVPVFLGGTDLVPTLTGLMSNESDPAIAHAAFLALDRLVINDPAAVLQVMGNDPSVLTGRESTRADYFARANVNDPQQRQILENYLLNPALSVAELQTFSGIYPNANFMLSPNLLTPAGPPNHSSLLEMDAQALAAAQQWLSDPRFASIAPEIQSITQRLTGYLAQARQNR